MYKIRMEDLESIHKHLGKVEKQLMDEIEENDLQLHTYPVVDTRKQKRLLKENRKWQKYLKDNYFQDGE